MKFEAAWKRKDRGEKRKSEAKKCRIAFKIRSSAPEMKMKSTWEYKKVLFWMNHPSKGLLHKVN